MSEKFSEIVLALTILVLEWSILLKINSYIN